MNADISKSENLAWRLPQSWMPGITLGGVANRPCANARASRLDDRENLQDCWKPAIQLDKEPAIIVREPDAPCSLRFTTSN